MKDEMTEDKNNTQTWLGTSLEDMCNGQGPWNFSVPPVHPSKYHHILYEVPVTLESPPIPHYNAQPKHWDDDHVRMPYSPESLFIVKENGQENIVPRWKLITETFSKPIKSSKALEQAIHTYNNKFPEFQGLHIYLNEICEQAEREEFFNSTLPGIIKLALELPNILPGSVPLLKQNHCKSISLSQLQIASLLANAFLSTFIWRKDIAERYPVINFARLFASNSLSKRGSCVTQKIKCIIHYFERVLANNPVGCITFERKSVHRSQLPKWDSLDKDFKNTKLHVSSTGTIENGFGFLQVDFANKCVGGGVLSYGCVQEEIRFSICPELIISRLFTEELGDNEALIIIGAERYSNYTGYADTFAWSGNVNDSTPYDDYGRRRTTVTVIDAIRFMKIEEQFRPPAVFRELNKAYVGFSCREKFNIAPVASGNWGCGAFRGNPYLKFLIQLMACRATNRSLVYYSFGDTTLRDEFYKIHLFLVNNEITIINLWRYLCRFCANRLPHEQLYPYIQQEHFDLKSQPTIKQFFSFKNKKQQNESVINNDKKIKLIGYKPIEPLQASTSSASDINTFPEKSTKQTEIIQSKPSPVKHSPNPEQIISFIDMIDGNTVQKSNESDNDQTLLNEIDKYQIVKKEHKILINTTEEIPMEVDCEEVKTKGSEPKKKITDYFKTKASN